MRVKSRCGKPTKYRRKTKGKRQEKVGETAVKIAFYGPSDLKVIYRDTGL